MIEADKFITAAKSHSFFSYTGVPCSFLTPFINNVINDNELDYICSANEGDAIATAAGMAIAGKKTIVMLQNSGLGNAVSPITSLLYTFKIPVLLIITLRGDPASNDEPQHELMGRITEDLLNLMEIGWEYFPDDSENIIPALGRAVNHMADKNQSYAFIMKKGSVKSDQLSTPLVSKNKLDNELYIESLTSLDKQPSRQEVLSFLQSKTNQQNSILLASTGYTGRELYALGDRKNQLYMVGSMGCASSLGLGLAIAKPDKSVVVIEGDGAAIMRMGNIATVGHYGDKNYFHIILDNEQHDSTGGQSTVSAGMNFAKIAQACGYPVTYFGNSIEMVNRLLIENQNIGPKLIHLKIKPGTMSKLPRPSDPPHQVVRRLMTQLSSSL